MNRLCRQLTKFSVEELHLKALASTLVAAEDAETVDQTLRESARSLLPAAFTAGLQAKDGARNRISWSLQVLTAGPSRRFLLVGREAAETAEAATRRRPGWLTADRPSIAMPAAASSHAGESSASAARSTTQDGRQRRRHSRLPYQFRQSIAPMHDARIPSAAVLRGRMPRHLGRRHRFLSRNHAPTSLRSW